VFIFVNFSFALFTPPLGDYQAAGPHAGAHSGERKGGGQLGRAGQMGRARGEGGDWAERGGEGGEREKKVFLFSLNLDEWFSQFQSNKTNAWFGMVQQTKIKYF
jgi:hypothetical protein